MCVCVFVCVCVFARVCARAALCVQRSPAGMPPVAFTYECDGRTELCAFNETVPIPFPSGPGMINRSDGEPAGAGRGCADGAACVPPPNVTRSFRKGYYASVTYADHLVGMLLDKLEQLKREDDTVVGLIGDHGCESTRPAHSITASAHAGIDV